VSLAEARQERQRNGTKPRQPAACSPLLLEEWTEFNRRRWSVQPRRLNLGTESGGASLEAILYLNKRGHVWQPPRNVYLPVCFTTPADTGASRSARQWSDLSKELAGHMLEAGIDNTITLLPEVTDVRAWQWAGFQAGVKYTYYQDFPYDISLANQSVRSRIKKAQKAGYVCRRADSAADVMACLSETEVRSGFDQYLTLPQMEWAQRLVGAEHFRCYGAYDSDGKPAAAYVVLHNEGGYALAWIISTRTAHLPSGVTQLLHHYVIQDLQDAGAAGFDMVGANMESIATAKASWGPRLVPYYYVQQYSVRRIAAHAYRGAEFMLRRMRGAGNGSGPAPTEP
jgi:hypothetical protein